MFRKTMVLFIICLTGLLPPATPAGAQGSNGVQIFDVAQKRVIKEVKPTPELQRLVAGWLLTAKEPYAKANPLPVDGYVIRVPLEPSAALRNRWIYADVEEVFLAIPAKEPPFYILLGDDGLLCYVFNGNLSLLSAALGMELKPAPMTKD